MAKLIFNLVIIVLVIITHEFGHTIFARLTGNKIKSIVIGMGPTIYQKNHIYIKLFPFGGYINLDNKQTFWSYLLICSGGVIIGLLLPVLLFSVFWGFFIYNNPHWFFQIENIKNIINEIVKLVPTHIDYNFMIKIMDFLYYNCLKTIFNNNLDIFLQMFLISLLLYLFWSVILNLFNLLPFPGFDGGRILGTITVRVVYFLTLLIFALNKKQKEMYLKKLILFEGCLNKVGVVAINTGGLILILLVGGYYIFYIY